MHEKLENSLDIISEMKKKSQLRAIPKLWFNCTTSLLIGVLFASVVQLGKLGLLTIPLILILVLIHYRNAGVWPYFFKPTGNVLHEIHEEFKSKLITNILLVVGMICSPFLLIKVLELKADGLTVAPLIGGILISAYTFFSAETSRRFYLKKYSS